MSEMTAKDIIATLGMERHPEGGWFVQTFKDAESVDGRARSTCIYYLLEEGEVSQWHRVDAVEVWHWYAGAPIALSISGGVGIDEHILGPDLGKGERPQVLVPHLGWQSARSLGAWTLVGCTVAPGFEFSGFELAEKCWSPKAV